ncbi:MAG: YkgJ family cysteine cluster protein [Desulfurivibrionaceae bacterium]
MEKEIFSCRMCGHCCHGETTVSLNEDDLARMVEYLGLPTAEVVEKYLRVTGKVIQMKIVDGHCIFYREGCLIHPGRPWRCGQWPLHPSIMGDETNLSAIRDSCPGIDQSLAYDDFCRNLARRLAAEKK